MHALVLGISAILCLLRTVRAQSNVQVNWNDSRIVYSSPSSDLWNQTWENYNTVLNASSGLGCGISAYPGLCSGFLSLCQVNDTASLSFIGTSVTVNFLDRWNGNSAVKLLLDGQLWTSVNTSNVDGEPWPTDTQALNSTPPVCIPTSVTKASLANQVHNVTVMVPQSDPRYGLVELLQGFNYVGSTSVVPLSVYTSTTQVAVSTSTISSQAASSSTTGAEQSVAHKSHTGPIVGGVIGAIVLILLAVTTMYLVLRRKARRVAVGRDLDLNEENFNKRGGSNEDAIAISPYDPARLTSSPRLEGAITIGQASKGGISLTNSAQSLIPRTNSPIRSGSNGRPSHLEVIQGLLDQGVPGPQIASVIKLIEEEEAALRGASGSNNVDGEADSDGPGSVASPPPEYTPPDRRRRKAP
ncbi:hypothetical protein FRB94_009940 [Tulasnella sp. JGI-2019a]|nr:hypothetical protein FRB94_009940 [Tulasnella sp. JGI-2019a]KAG9009206.1 hypothetical protein FRB93_005702 [Tulasnella sp. JGI-2019a]